MLSACTSAVLVGSWMDADANNRRNVQGELLDRKRRAHVG